MAKKPSKVTKAVKYTIAKPKGLKMTVRKVAPMKGMAAKKANKLFKVK